VVDESRSEALGLLRRLAAGDDQPYNLGLCIWQLSMGHAKNWVFYLLWLLWGALTDWIENKPMEATQAEEAMVQAANEFLQIVGDGEREHAYVDYWLYGRIGYERPA